MPEGEARVIDRKDPHAAYREELAARIARDRREDAIYTGASFAVVLMLLVVFAWMVCSS